MVYCGFITRLCLRVPAPRPCRAIPQYVSVYIQVYILYGVEQKTTSFTTNITLLNYCVCVSHLCPRGERGRESFSDGLYRDFEIQIKAEHGIKMKWKVIEREISFDKLRSET